MATLHYTENTTGFIRFFFCNTPINKILRFLRFIIIITENNISIDDIISSLVTI